MRAFLVLGPESSGTRLMTRILIAAGCLGDPGHVQHFDEAIPLAGAAPIVWRRSLPHDNQWPDIRDMVNTLNGAGYIVKAVVMSRAWWAMLPSQVKNGHVQNEQIALQRSRRAYPHIFGQLYAANVPYVVVSYEGLVGEPELTIRHTFELLRLIVPPIGAIEDIVDGNGKWANSVLTN